MTVILFVFSSYFVFVIHKNKKTKHFLQIYGYMFYIKHVCMKSTVICDQNPYKSFLKKHTDSHK